MTAPLWAPDQGWREVQMVAFDEDLQDQPRTLQRADEGCPEHSDSVPWNSFSEAEPPYYFVRQPLRPKRLIDSLGWHVCRTKLPPNFFPTVPEGHKHRVTTPGTLGKSRGPPQNPAETPQNPRRDPAEPSERPPQSPLRGEFPRRASRRVVPLGWWPSGTFEFFEFDTTKSLKNAEKSKKNEFPRASATQSGPQISGGPKRGHLKGGYLTMGFRTAIRTWHVDFALKLTLDTSILTALSTSIPQGKGRLDRESAA